MTGQVDGQSGCRQNMAMGGIHLQATLGCTYDADLRQVSQLGGGKGAYIMVVADGRVALGAEPSPLSSAYPGRQVVHATD